MIKIGVALLLLGIFSVTAYDRYHGGHGHGHSKGPHYEQCTPS